MSEYCCYGIVNEIQSKYTSLILFNLHGSIIIIVSQLIKKKKNNNVSMLLLAQPIDCAKDQI